MTINTLQRTSNTPNKISPNRIFESYNPNKSPIPSLPFDSPNKKNNEE